MPSFYFKLQLACYSKIFLYDLLFCVIYFNASNSAVEGNFIADSTKATGSTKIVALSDSKYFYKESGINLLIFL